MKQFAGLLYSHWNRVFCEAPALYHLESNVKKFLQEVGLHTELCKWIFQDRVYWTGNLPTINNLKYEVMSRNHHFEYFFKAAPINHEPAATLTPPGRQGSFKLGQSPYSSWSLQRKLTCEHTRGVWSTCQVPVTPKERTPFVNPLKKARSLTLGVHDVLRFTKKKLHGYCNHQPLIHIVTCNIHNEWPWTMKIHPPVI